MRYRPILVIVGLLSCVAPALGATSTIDRQFAFDPAKVRVSHREGYTRVDVPGAAREPRAGRPDLPIVAERVELPPGMRVSSIEVTGVSTEPLASGALVAPTIVPTPGLGPVERSKPDAQFFGAGAGLQPANVVTLGTQGDLRGHTVALLGVSPVQWDPASGDLRAVRSVSVRLTLESDPTPALRRERIVREWEDGPLPVGVPTVGAAATVTSLAASAGSRRAAPLKAEQVPSVLGSPVAYVIVTSDAMASTFQQLADWKTQSGLPAVVRTTSFIRSQYPAATDDAERIRMFIRDAYTRWGTKWVLLGGDTSVIPARLAKTTFYGGEMIASDLYYSCLDGNWNADGDSLFGEGFLWTGDPGDNVDLLPEVYVGRAAVETAPDAQVFVNKTMQYEKTPLGNYEFRWLFAAEVLFPHPYFPPAPVGFDGGAVAEALLPLTDERPALHVARLYQNYTDTTFRAPVYVETKQAVIDSMNSGVGLVMHVGHGYRNVMEVADGDLTNADAGALTNGNKLFNLYSINCTSNAIDFPCIGEAFVNNPNGGAVTNVGSTRFDFPSTGQNYQYEYFRLFVEDSVTAVGELQARQKLPFLVNAFYDSADRWTIMTLLELGDPELRMWMGAPTTLAVAYPATIAVSDTTISVTVTSASLPVANAHVTAYRAGTDFETGLTNSAGQVTLPFRPDSLGSLTLTVTAFNARPFQAPIAIASASAPVMANGQVVIVDNGSGGTSGDGNASVDAGELVDLRVPLRNNGGSTASAVSATLSTTDPLVTVVTATAGYGSVASGVSALASSPASGFRVSFPASLEDQREVPFSLVIVDGGGHSWRQTFQLVVHAPELRSYAHTESEPSGNGNGKPEPGETVNYGIALRNNGTGTAHGVTLVLRSYDGFATVTDSTSTYGDLAPGATVTGDLVQFQPSSAAAVLTGVVTDAAGRVTTQRFDLALPPTPVALTAAGGASSISLVWGHVALPDMFGYNVYRSPNSGGPFTKVTALPTGLTSAYTDPNLTPLTRYYYRVSAVDSSGNESGQSSIVGISTNPPVHTVFPVTMGRTTPSSVALEHVWSSTSMDIIAGSDKLYALHADGTAPVDADGSSLTTGDFSVRGSYFAAGPSAAVLDPSQGWSIVGPAWDSDSVYVFDKAGNVRPGWPLYTNASVWSSVACGDLDGDGKMELCFGSNGNNFYVMHANGTEMMDGDSNPATLGVFKVLGTPYNYGTPALADLDGDGKAEIIYGGFDGYLYAWKANGTNVPGFPFYSGSRFLASPAVAYLDGPGDTTPEIIIPSTGDSLYVIEPNGTRRPGWPVWVRSDGSNSKTPSPAIADMNNDGLPDIVFQGTNGQIFCLTGAGVPLAPVHGVRYTPLTSSASECSPVVADINGDGFNDVITGDESAALNAISGADGTTLPGFPIQLAGEVRGAPAVADIDGDGKTEIVVADWDKNLYVWDYDFPFQPSGVAPWPQFHHDARRTGFASAPLFLGVDGTPDASTPTASLEFAPPSPNPASGTTRMWFGVPKTLSGQTYSLSIYDVGGRRVSLVDSGIAKAGRFSLQWDLRDASRRPVAGGVYFARFTLGSQTLSRKLVVLQ